MSATFKVFYPKINEIRLITFYYESVYYVWDALRKQVRNTFELDELFEFHFVFIDEQSDSIHLKTREELKTFLYLYRKGYPPLTIVADSTQETEPQTMDTSQANQSSHSNDPKILESLEAFIKHLELGINDMQEKIEKNTTSTIDIIVKTAAETAAHVHRSLTTSSKNSTSVKPMHDVICNGCYRPIRGQRYLCETCDDFDLCSACKSRVNHDATHNFRYIAPIDNNPPPPKMTEQHSSDESSCSTQSRSAQNRFFCDNCDSEIVGVRHTCTSCPDFDLCNKCFYSDKYEHPERHLLITHVEDSQKMPEKTINKKAKKPSNDKAHIIQHTGVECDSCDTPIEGIRYKCGNCPNYDLCEQCEEKASLIHDENHAFVKLRRPIQSVVHMPLLPELRFLDAATAETSNTPEVVSKPEEVSYTNIPQKPLPITPEPLINASFVSDLNIPEGTVIVPKKTFIKMWKVKNTGTVDWPIGTQLLFNGGSILRPYPVSRPDCFAVPVVAPNEETCITAELQAPDSPGVYTSYFCICTPNGERFGDSLLCSIKVDEDLEPEKKPSSMPRTTSDISLSNSHIMVYPTIDSYSETHDDVSRQDELSQKDSNPVYPEYDACSDTTSGNHSSVVESQTTYTYTDSQVSSPTSLNLDMHDDYTDNEWNPEAEGVYSADDYHVISPPRSPSPVFSEESPKQETPSPCFDEDEFIVLDNKQDEIIVEVEEMTTDTSSLTNSSITATPEAGHPYQSQLLQLHEMGFSSYDDLALSLLRFYEGEMERVVSKLLEYP